MESLTGKGNVTARVVAKRMIERAQDGEEEPNKLSDEESDDDIERKREQAFAEELLKDADDPYDSDDPRSLGGEYYWQSISRGDAVTFGRKARDRCRYGCFYVLRSAGFILLVFQHFFGLNKSRFQWAIDLVEKEKERRDRVTLEKISYTDE